MHRTITVNISARSVLIAIAMILGLWLATQIPTILIMVVVSLILAAAMLPGVMYFHEKLKWPRTVAVLAVFGSIFAVVTLLGLIVVPTIVEQAQELAKNLPEYTKKVRGTYSWVQQLDSRFHVLPTMDELATAVSSFAAGWLTSTLGWAGKIVGGFLSIFLVLVTTFFIMLDGPDLKRGFLSMIPPVHRPLWAAQFDPIAHKLGAYVNGVGISIGFLTTYLAIALSLAGVPLALALAIIAGCLEIIPMVGSLLGSIPAILIALTVSWKLALIVLAIFLAGNFIQSNFVQPFVFSKSIEVSPLMVLLSLLIGGQLLGIAGALIAVPVMAAIQVLIQNLYIDPLEHKLAIALPDGVTLEPKVITDDKGLPPSPPGTAP